MIASQVGETIILEEAKYERRQEVARKAIKATQICQIQASNETDSNVKIVSEKVCYPKDIQVDMIHSFEGQTSANRPLEGETQFTHSNFARANWRVIKRVYPEEIEILNSTNTLENFDNYVMTIENTEIDQYYDLPLTYPELID